MLLRELLEKYGRHMEGPQVCAELHVANRTLQGWRRGEVDKETGERRRRGPPFVRVSATKVLYPTEGVAAFIERRTFDPEAEVAEPSTDATEPAAAAG